jgi:IclR family KDG regulon transcriptional repressor
MKPATTVTKVCRVMEQFQERQSLGITDLARRTGLLPSDVHRILMSLRANRYIWQDPETKKYRLGVALMRLGLTAFERNLMREKAQPIMTQLSRRLDATTHLGLLDGQRLELILIDQISGPTAEMLQVHLGETEQLHCTALGKAILANFDHRRLASALEKSGMPPSTCNTITNAAALELQLEQVRRCGYSVDHEEFTKGVCCIGSSIRDFTGAVVGAISTSMPKARFLEWGEAQLGEILRTAGDNLSAVLGPTES